MQIQPRPRPASRRLALLVCAAALLAVPLPASADRVLMGRNVADFSWDPAPGPVAGYAIHIAREGAAFAGPPIATRPPDGRHYRVVGNFGQSIRVRITAFDAQGNFGPPSEISETIRFETAPDDIASDAAYAIKVSLAPSADRAIGLATRLDGSIRAVFEFTREQIPPDLPLGALSDVRAARCNLDGEGHDEFLLGFGDGSGGWLQVRSAPETGMTPLAWIRLMEPAFNERSGETHPACGDVDGDGRDEAVIGLGLHGNSTIHVLEDALEDYSPLARVGSSPRFYDYLNGELRPTVVDLDNDGRAEVAVVRGVWSQSGVEILDDAFASFAPMRELPYSILRPEGLEWAGVHLTALDIDGDGWQELAVGLQGSDSIQILDDFRLAFRPHGGVIAARGTSLISLDAIDRGISSPEARPVAADLDGDGLPEVVAHLRGTGQLRLLGGVASGYAPLDDRAFDGWIESPAWTTEDGAVSFVAN